MTDTMELYVDELARQRDAAVNQSLGVAVKSDPDREANINSLSSSLGLPKATVERNQLKVEQLKRRTEVMSILNASPILKMQMADPEFAKLSHDDVQTLSTAEGLFGGLKPAWKTTRAIAGGLQSMVTNATYGVGELGSALLSENLGSPGDSYDVLHKFFKTERQKAMQLATDIRGEQSNNFIGNAIYSGADSIGRMLPGMAASIITKNPQYALMAGALDTGIQSATKGMDKGLSANRALLYGSEDAAFEYLTELIPTNKLLGDLAAGSGFARTLAHQMAREIPGELAATALQNFDEYVNLNPNAPFKDYLSSLPQDLASTAVSTAFTTLLMTGGAKGLHRVINGKEKADTATHEMQGLAALQETARESKLAARSPSTFNQVIQRMADEIGDAPKEVFINANMLMQSAKEAGVSIESLSPSAAQQIEVAADSNADVAVPVGEWAANIATQPIGDTLLEHMKTDPDGFTLAEGKQFYTEQEAQLETEARKLIQQKDTEDQFINDAHAVEKHIYDQLKETSRYSDEVSKAYAMLMRDHYVSQAARLGITPAQVFEQNPLNIGSNVTDGFNQPERGGYDPETNTIAILKAADLSTFHHESGHFFLETLNKFAEQSHDIGGDFDRALQWFGLENTPELSARDQWRMMSLEDKRTFHEKFARGYEAYLREGKAPSLEAASVFQRFKAWMMRIYKSALELNVDLNDEVRGVYDRLLATSEQIKIAEQSRSMMLIFSDATSAAMTPEEFAAYQAMNKDASTEATDELMSRSIADMKYIGNARAKALARVTKEIKALRSEARIEARRDVMQQRVYMADSMLASVDAKNFSHADKELFAEQVGYTSANEMQREVLSAPPVEDAIEARTDEIMMERHGDINSTERIADAVDAAVHNDVRLRVLATEYRALTKSTGPVSLVVKAAKEAAQRAIGEKRIMDIKKRIFTSAETRAAKNAEDAFRRGEVERAAAEKRNQILNNQLAKAAIDGLNESDRIVKYLKKFDSPGVRENIDPEYQDQIDQLLEQYDLRQVTQKEMRRRKSLRDWLAVMEEDGIVPDVPDSVLNNARVQNYRELTVDEIRSLFDTVKMIEHLGRLKNHLLTSKALRDFAAARDTIANSIEAHSKGRTANTRTPTTGAGRAMRGLKRYALSHIKVNTLSAIMDGGDAGPVWDYLVRPANERGNMETTMRAKATKELTAIISPIIGNGGLGGNGFHFDSINRSLNKESRIALALNVGNESNLQRLLGGEGWTLEQIKPVLNSLTLAEWQAVQDVWDYMDSYRPMIAEKERRVFGKEPEWIKPTPFSISTADGHTIGLRGGYFPVVYDPLASQRAEEHADAEAAKRELKGAYTSATTRRGFTKPRVDEVHGRPLLLSLSGVYSGVNDVIHDLAWHEWLIDANRLTKSNAIDSAIRQHYGPEVKEQFKSWIKDIAEGDRQAYNASDAAASFLRQGVSSAIMAYNVRSAVMQLTGFGNSFVLLGPTYAGRGITAYLKNPIQLTREINAKSDFMLNRQRTRFRELNELRNKVQGESVAGSMFKNSAYFLMMRAQQMVDVPTWQGAYEKAIIEGSDESRAISLADQAVIDAQGSGMTKDLSAIERGSSMAKLFTVFYSFMNTSVNLAARQTMTAKSRGKMASDLLMIGIVIPVMSDMLRKALTPGGDDDWELDKLAESAVASGVDNLMGMFVYFREFSGAAKAFLGVDDKKHDYQGPTGLRMITDVYSIANQAKQGEFDAAFFRASLNTLGDFTGLPSAQVNRTIAGVKALSEGKTDNPFAVVMGYQE